VLGFGFERDWGFRELGFKRMRMRVRLSIGLFGLENHSTQWPNT